MSSQNKENIQPQAKRRPPWFRHHNPGTKYVYDGPRKEPTIRVISNFRIVPPRTVPFDPRKAAEKPTPTPKFPCLTKPALLKTTKIPDVPRPPKKQDAPKPVLQEQTRPRHPRVLPPSPPRSNKKSGDKPRGKSSRANGRKRPLPKHDLRHKLLAKRREQQRPLEPQIPWRKPAEVDIPPFVPLQRGTTEKKPVRKVIPWQLRPLLDIRQERIKFFDATGKDPRSCNFRVVLTIPPPDVPRRRTKTPPTPRTSPIHPPLSPLPATPEKRL